MARFVSHNPERADNMISSPRFEDFASRQTGVARQATSGEFLTLNLFRAHL
jgi:hypothetical protein